MNERMKLYGSSVVVQNDNVEKALRKFKKKIMESGKLQELREREFYEKPTTKRKKAAAQAKRRWQKKLQAESLPKKLYWCKLGFDYLLTKPFFQETLLELTKLQYPLSKGICSVGEIVISNSTRWKPMDDTCTSH